MPEGTWGFIRKLRSNAQHHFAQNTSGIKMKWRPTVLAENIQGHLSVDPDISRAHRQLFEKKFHLLMLVSEA